MNAPTNVLANIRDDWTTEMRSDELKGFLLSGARVGRESNDKEDATTHATHCTVDSDV